MEVMAGGVLFAMDAEHAATANTPMSIVMDAFFSGLTAGFGTLFALGGLPVLIGRILHKPPSKP